MSHGVKYLVWRGGRPRWVPGQALRARGFKGKDLKDKNGNWLPWEFAKAEAERLNDLAGVPQGKKKVRPPTYPGEIGMVKSDKGYVYFLVLGQSVKIGFATDPVSRFRSSWTYLPDEPDLYVAVEGSVHEERRLHSILHEDRKKGEWFHLTTRVMKIIARSAFEKKVAFDWRGWTR